MLPRRHRVLALILVGVACFAPITSHGVEENAAGRPPKLEASIAVDSLAGSDAKIRTRLKELFATIEGLGAVVVEVSSGVVALSGEVSSSAVHDQALRLTRRVEGVVEVRDQIVESRDLRKRLAQMRDRVIAQLLNFVTYLPLLIVAGLVLALFWWIAGLIAGSKRLSRRFGRNPFMLDLMRQIVRIVTVGMGLLLALEILDASTLVGSLLGVAGIFGLAVGFALRDTVENYIASLLLSLRQPFSRDDLVSIEEFEGRVLRLNARATIMLTLDGNHLRIPNAKVYKAVIVNYTRNPKRRFHFDIGVDTEQNLAAAQQLAASTLVEMDGIERDPPPVCTVEALGESNVVLRVFGWVDQTKAEFLKVRSESIRLVKGAFDRAGVVMPEPIYNLRIDDRFGTGTPLAASVRPLDPAGAPPTEAGKGKNQFAEPSQAIDIARRDELVQQIAADRGANEEDLLRPGAARE
ncbi:MAG: mechanosensitive ion channel [Burkholderiales bacterium]|nr:mechanosensitive ion channel [Burkholderiales bacterium]